MDTTLAINPGSSSKKYALFQGGVEVFSVRFERTGDQYGKCVSVRGIQNHCEDIAPSVYAHSLHECLALCMQEGVIQNETDITHVGIRIVAPHSFLTSHRPITARYLQVLRSLRGVAPLHVPYILDDVQAAEEALPHAVLVGVSDSAFHSTMPSYASIYSLPAKDREAYHVYRFGYHGLSVESVVKKLATPEGAIPPRVIVVHVGSGVSVTAVRDGASIDTTMGFSPASGVIMGSRGGDIDSAALLHVAREKRLDLAGTEAYLNSETGLRGLAGTNDLRIILDRAQRGDSTAIRAREAFLYQLHKAIHGYVGILGGLDVLVLTATAMERNQYLRTRITECLAYQGCVIDQKMNELLTERRGVISAPGSVIAVEVIPTEEMRMIACHAEEGRA